MVVVDALGLQGDTCALKMLAQMFGPQR
uniref:Uncharacterized protein n=1 Tax=Anopheles arabiensis TaxID=7173 RepID=A0A182IGN6_ANOAR